MLTHTCTTPFSWLGSALDQVVHAVWKRFWGDPPSFQYAFSQQSNADCHLQSWTNFYRLQELRDRSPTRKLSLEAADFKTHRQWFAETFLHFQKWLESRNGPQMQEYMREALQQAPCAPELFNSAGVRYVDESWNPLERGERASLSPVFLQQIPDKDLSYTLPIFEKEGRWFCFDQDTRQYEPIQEGANFSKGQRASLPPDFDSLKLVKLPGKTPFIQAIDPALAVGERFVPRHLGTYKLLLLNLGIGQAPAALETQTAMRKADTPWNPARCKKEHLIEHALATLFQQDPVLKEKVQKHVDFFFRTWGRYKSDLPRLRNGQGHSFTQEAIDRYLPDEEHMLAYCLMQNVQFLWFSAISSTAFCRHMALPKITTWIPFVPGPSQYRKAAYQTGFMEVWREVAARIQAKFPERQDWVSFAGHGMVLSFDPDLIQQQNERPITDPTLAQNLGFAVIDSLHGKAMNVFYRR